MMNPGRPGRIPQLVAILKNHAAPMSTDDIVKTWGNNPAYDYSTKERIAASLTHAAANARSTGIVRVAKGVYQYRDPATQGVKADRHEETPRTKEVRETVKRLRSERLAHHVESAIAETDRVLEQDAPERGTFDILHTLPDGRILLRENWRGTVWIAKEV